MTNEIARILIYTNIGSKWDMLLAKIPLLKISKPMGSTIFIVI